MIIKLSPVRSDTPLTVFRLGDMLTINNVALDFSSLPDGATLPAGAVGSQDLLDPIERKNGKLFVSLRLPHVADAPDEARFPADVVDPPNGAVQLPGLQVSESSPSVAGAIDWSRVITAEDKAASVAAQVLAAAVAEIAARRALADRAVAQLQDSVDLGDDTPEEEALLLAWKRYRRDLSRIPGQPGYPDEIDWPSPPV